MLDQSYSPRNLKAILDFENRKGNYVEQRLFPLIQRLDSRIKSRNATVRAIRLSLRKARSEYYRTGLATLVPIIESLANKLTILYRHIRKYKEIRHRVLSNELQSLASTLARGRDPIRLQNAGKQGGKQLFRIDDGSSTFFQIKQTQYNLKKSFKIHMRSRDSILSQLIGTLEGALPKFLLRIDITSFYESIDTEILLSILKRNSILETASYKTISKTLSVFQKLAGTTKGVPRGVGLSAALSEIYMQQFDADIQAREDVIFYGRYVDDIVVVFDSHFFPAYSLNDYEKILSDHLAPLKLSINTAKTDGCSLPSNKSIDFLGYRIEIRDESVKVELSGKRSKRYKTRLRLAFSEYQYHSKKDEKAARKLLVRRVRFLTGNTHLVNNKRNAMVGVSFTNQLLTLPSSSLKSLDGLLTHLITSISNSKLKTRLKKYSFVNGFESRIYHKFSSQQIGEIVRIWKYVP